MSFQPRIGRWLAALLLVMVMAAVAQTAHIRTVIFPETAALALGVWVLGEPRWLQKPWHIVVLPTVCAALGVLVNHTALPTMERELLMLWVAVVLLTVTRSSLSPAISAGILPIVLDVQAWVFVYSVFAATGILWISGRRQGVSAAASPEELFPAWRANAAFAMVATLWIGVAGTFGIRDAVLPPIMVFLYGSMKAQPMRWGRVCREIAVVMVAAVSASWAVAVLHHPIAVAALALTTTTLAMRVLKTWVLPAGAVALLPLVLPISPVSKFPLLVAILTVSAATIGLLSQRGLLGKTRVRGGD